MSKLLEGRVDFSSVEFRSQSLAIPGLLDRFAVKQESAVQPVGTNSRRADSEKQHSARPKQ
jgi:hypothetical protein